ncbi:MAG: hypothetical protein EON54_24080 [Alcaligenaceae bacterium]|nr:MAG: hypothetical protein EON54_24080 [Alcaligenaceae bacterium]
METEVSEKESSSKPKMPRVAVITILVLIAFAIVGAAIWMNTKKGDVVTPAEESVSVESLLQESRDRGFIPVGDLPQDSETDVVSSLEFDAKAEGSSCFFTMKWTSDHRWSLVKQASSANQGNDFKLSNPDLTTLKRVNDFASCFAQTEEVTESTPTP